MRLGRWTMTKNKCDSSWNDYYVLNISIASFVCIHRHSCPFTVKLVEHGPPLTALRVCRRFGANEDVLCQTNKPQKVRVNYSSNRLKNSDHRIDSVPASKMEKCIADISKEFPCRTKLLTDLFHMFGHPNNYGMPSSVFLYGAAGVGKTSILLKTLNYLQITHAMIDCVEHYAPKLFYESIVNTFRGHVLTQNNNFENFAPCDSTESFLDEMRALDTSRPYVLVLKNYQRLHGMDANILPVLMRFKELLPDLNISCVLIGSKWTRQHNSKLGLVPCQAILCDHYGKADLLQILLLQMDHLQRTMQKLVLEDRANRAKKEERLAIIDDLQVDFYSGYFSIFLDTFYSICRNVKELLYLSNANFPIYCKPVVDGLIKKDDRRKLWKNMELPFKTAMGTIYCRVDQKNANVSTPYILLECLRKINSSTILLALFVSRIKRMMAKVRPWRSRSHLQRKVRCNSWSCHFTPNIC